MPVVHLPMDTIGKLRELYELHPAAKDDFRGRGGMDNYTSSLEHFLRELDQNPPADFSMKTLEVYPDDSPLAIVLAHLPVEVLYSELGDDALLWTWVRYPYKDQKNIVAKGIQRVTGRDPQRMEKARLTAWQLLHTDKVSLVRAIYDLNEAVLGGIANSIDLPNLLQAHARKDVQLSNERLTEYSLDPLTTERDLSHGYDATWSANNYQNEDKRHDLWLDSPVGLALLYKRRLNAVIGFFPSEVGTLMIYQLQGVRPTKIGAAGKPVGEGSSRGLMPIDWQKLLVGCIEAIGQKLGYSQIGIQSGHNNEWTRPYRDGKVHLPLEEALKKYDGVAERLGFRQAGNKNWYRGLR